MDREERQKVGTGLAKAKQPKQFIGCFDCKRKCPSYMVRNEVWMSAWPTYKKDKISTEIYLELCLACLRERLNRPLTIDDFTDSPINDGVRVGFELGIDYVLQRMF